MTRNERRPPAGRELVALLLVLLVSTSARGAEGDEAAARALFTEGRKLVDEGKFAEGCAKFEESLRHDAGVGTKFNLADCLERVGRTASAWARFLDVAASSKAAGQEERERVARARAAALEPLLARLVVNVTAPSAELTVTRDGLELGAASWGVAIPVDPGEHRIDAKAPGQRPWSGVAEVPAAATTVGISVPALEALPPEARDAPPPKAPDQQQPAPTPPPSRWSTPVIALGAIGTVALATSVVLAFEVKVKNDEAKGLCPVNNSCTSEDEKQRHDTLIDDAQQQLTWTYVSAGVGAAALLTAGYLLWQPFAPTSQGVKATLFPRLRPMAVEMEIKW